MGEMADFFLFSHYDVDNFDEDALSNYYRRRYRTSRRVSNYDPTYYSRRAAKFGRVSVSAATECLPK